METKEKEKNRELALKGRKEELERIDRINEAIADRTIEDYEDSDDYRDPISITVKKEIEIQLSWGGPSDGFKLYYDNENHLIGGVYYHANWWVYDEVDLTTEEADKVDAFYLYGDPSAFLGSKP